jgi:hypothetical protein
MGKESYLRVPITMPEEMFAYLEEMSLKAKVTKGKKLPNTAIVRAAVSAMMEMDVDFTGVVDEDQLKDRIMEASSKYQEQ